MATLMEHLTIRIAEELAIEELDLEQRWHIFVKRTEATEEKFKPKLIAAFTKQEKAVLSTMRGKPVPDTSKSIIRLEKAVSDEAMAAAEAYLGDKFNRDDWQESFEALDLPFVTEAFKEAGEAVFNEIGVGGAFNVTNPRAAKYLDEKTFQFAQSVNKTTEDALRRTLAAGFDKGEDIRALSARVADVFGIAKGSRTDTIVRTEIVGASNNGTYHGYVESELVETKIWIDSRDDKVRTAPHDHKIDGQERKLKELFSNGLLHPHDPNGAAGNVIRCRCTTRAGELKEP